MRVMLCYQLMQLIKKCKFKHYYTKNKHVRVRQTQSHKNTCKKANNNTHVDSISKGKVRTEDTEPVKRQRYILQAVRGTTPSQATATRV